MESWRMVWREGFVPVLPLEGLKALREALIKDDPTLAQGCTTTPPPLMSVSNWPLEAGDAIVYVGWKGDNRRTVGEAEQFFAEACFEADQRLKEPAACRWFLNWFDDTPRPEMLEQLLPEVERAIAEHMSAMSQTSPSA